MATKKNTVRILSVLVILIIIFASLQPVSAQSGDGLSRRINAGTGRVSLIEPEIGRALSASQALGTFVRPQDPAMALARRFGPEFGLRDPQAELSEIGEKEQEDGRLTVRYRQEYQGIPVMGGELIVNTNEQGDLYSMNGEISLGIKIQVEPTLTSDQAQEIALQSVAKWSQMAEEDFVVTEPELWIFDESLLKTSMRPVELVWRMDVTSSDSNLPIRELVLVNAERGGISLHFNQVDTTWARAEQNRQGFSAIAGQNLEGTTWYVATTGNDANSCSSTGSPCATINGAISKASAGHTIRVSSGTYTGSGERVVILSKNVNLSGGWNGSFTNQNEFSTIDGQHTRQGILVMTTEIVASVDRFIVQNAYNGGIYNIGTLTITNSSLNHNIASGSGGGLFNSGTATVTNTTISDNTAVNGGGIWTQGPLYLNNATIVRNYASNNGGGIILPSGPAATITMYNSILAENEDAFDSPNCYGVLSSSSGWNLFGTLTSYCDAPLANGNQFETNLHLDSFSAATGVYPLLLGSPAIDSGNPRTCLATDQRGVARPQGGGCDIGAYEYEFNRSAGALIISTYNAGNVDSLPGVFVCNQADLTCAAGDSHAKGAHRYAAGTYNFYKTQYNRNSIDGAGLELISTVHFDRNYSNAFWNGYMMVYGDAYGYPLADDVVAHELTHGVTQYESNLFYYYQSGAINESFSDLWGEYYDQTNGLGNDTTEARWLVGEDILGMGALRSMNNPPAYGDPDRMSSSFYYESSGDNGGVHTNSGLNNKAVYLMVVGGTFNGKTVSTLGWEKVGAIYYEVQTKLLASGADYSDLYYALQQACTNLIGQKGITTGDCVEVKDALDAVEMNAQPAPNFNTDAPLCNVYDPNIAFDDDLETGTANWTINNGSYLRWQYDSPWGSYAQSGEHFLYGDDYPQYYGSVTDARATLKGIIVPNNAYLHFAHAYDFEQYGTASYDGGVLEYSTNGGASWVDAGSLIEANGYKGIIYPNYNNPLKGRTAFVGSSHGYISTRVNLASVAGQTVSFRWRMGLDDSVSALGWAVDSVKIYICGPLTRFADVPNTHMFWEYIEAFYNSGITVGCVSQDPKKYCPNALVTRAEMATFIERAMGNFNPNPNPTGMFADVPYPGLTHLTPFIEEFYNDGITTGCSQNPLKYCPAATVTRAEMATFIERAIGNFSPQPASTGMFADVPYPGLEHLTPFIEQFYNDGITTGCAANPLRYCPANKVTRAEMAVFIVRAFDIPLP